MKKSKSQVKKLSLHVTGVTISNPLLELASLESLRFGGNPHPPISRKHIAQKLVHRVSSTDELASGRSVGTPFRRAVALSSLRDDAGLPDSTEEQPPLPMSRAHRSDDSSYFKKSQQSMRAMIHGKTVGTSGSSSTLSESSTSPRTTQPHKPSSTMAAASSDSTKLVPPLPTAAKLKTSFSSPVLPVLRASSSQAQAPPATPSAVSGVLANAKSPRRAAAPEASTEPKPAPCHGLRSSVLDFLRSISAAVAEVSTMRDLVCASLCKLLGAQRAYLYDVDTMAAVTVLCSRDPGTSKPVCLRFPTSRGIAGLVATSGVSANVVNAPSHQRFDAAVDDPSASSAKAGGLLSVPFLSEEGDTEGLVTVVRQSEGVGNPPFSRDDEETLLAVVPFIFSALQNSLAIGRRQSLLEAGRAISAELEAPAVYSAIVTKATELFECEAAQLFLVDDSTKEVYLAPVTGSGKEVTPLMEKRGLACHVVATGEPAVLWAEVLQHPHFDTGIDQPPGVVVRNVAVWPVSNGKSLMGALELVNQRGGLRAPAPEEAELVRLFLGQCSEAIQNASLFGKTIAGYQAARATQGKFQALLEVAESLLLHLDVGGLAAMILQRARELVNAERSSLFLIDSETSELVTQVAEGTEEGIRLKMGEGIAGHVATTGEVQNITDAYGDPRFNPSIDRQTGFKTRNIICVPIRNTCGAIIGVTEIINKRGGSFSKEDGELLKAFSIFCGLALHNAASYDRALQQQHRSQALFDVVMALTGDTNIAPLLSTIMSRARDLIDADRASLFVVDPKTKELRSQISDGAEGEIVLPSEPTSVAGFVASTGQELVVSDAYSDPRFNPSIDRQTGYTTRSMMAIPILNEAGEVVAVTEMINKRGGGAFKDEDKQLVKAFANFCGKSLSELITTYRSSASSSSSVPPRHYPAIEVTAADHETVVAWDFNVNRHQSHEELIRLVVAMFQDLGLLEEFHVPLGKVCLFPPFWRDHAPFDVFDSLFPEQFLAFLHELSQSYNKIPYHNFFHAVDVTQFLFLCVRNSTRIQAALTRAEQFGLMLAGLCHDIDHGGLNNAFQVNAQTPLAMLFQNMSIMETYHASRSIAILSNEATDVLCGVSDRDRQHLWGFMIAAILATDMAVHFSVLAEFEQLVKGSPGGKAPSASTPGAKGSAPGVARDAPPAALAARAMTAADLSAQQRKLIGKVLIKIGDISNVCRNFDLAKEWAEILLREFFRQGDIERAKGLPLSPFMDREHVIMAQMQLGFINSIAFPMFNLVAMFAPELKQSTVDVLVANSNRWAAVLAKAPADKPKAAAATDEDEHRRQHGKV